jgi:hypothetical protein
MGEFIGCKNDRSARIFVTPKLASHKALVKADVRDRTHSSFPEAVGMNQTEHQTSKIHQQQAQSAELLASIFNSKRC